MGYLVQPSSLISALCKAKQINEGIDCTLTQTALASFMLNRDCANHLRRMHKHYTTRQHALLCHLTAARPPVSLRAVVLQRA